ncbi:GMC oxidoreductase [Streptomyces sp. NPDC000134]|uniref:GMC oxidoreductase n=1 Tax=Streptomyces sp. NPDC000134 TaxID=3364536 RepID=UPI00369947B3
MGIPLDDSPVLLPAGSSLHYQGTTRMGPADDGTSVCDRDSRVWNVHGLWVAGNNVIPTATACNPTLTSVAVAVRGARALVDTWRRRPIRRRYPLADPASAAHLAIPAGRALGVCPASRRSCAQGGVRPPGPPGIARTGVRSPCGVRAFGPVCARAPMSHGSPNTRTSLSKNTTARCPGRVPAARRPA